MIKIKRKKLPAVNKDNLDLAENLDTPADDHSSELQKFIPEQDEKFIPESSEKSIPELDTDVAM